MVWCNGSDYADLMVTWWVDALGFAELVFVTCFFVTETLRLIFRSHLNRMEQAAQVIPPERFFQQVAAPLLTAVAGVLVAIGAIWYTSNNGTQSYLGLLTIVFSMILLGRYLLRSAAGSYPRPVARARVRRTLVEAGERLDSDLPLSSAEAERLRARLDRLSRFGDRLTDRSHSWRQAVQSEPRLLVSAVVGAILLAAAGAVTAIVRMAEGRPLASGASALVVCIALLGATLAAVAMRRIRRLRDTRDLGAEVRAMSQVLLDRLAQATLEPPSLPPSASSLRVLWRRLLRSSHLAGSPLGRNLGGPQPGPADDPWP